MTKQLKVQGFIVSRWLPRWNEAFIEITQWITEVHYVVLIRVARLQLILIKGKLKYREKVDEGFDNIFDSFVSLFKPGTNIGKVVVKI